MAVTSTLGTSSTTLQTVALNTLNVPSGAMTFECIVAPTSAGFSGAVQWVNWV